MASGVLKGRRRGNHLMKTWLGLAVLAFGSVAAAAPLKVRNGSAVRVVVHGQREAGVGLKAQKGGWKLDLGGTQGAKIDLIDVTEGGSNGTRWSMQAADVGGLFLESGDRFIAGHAYRVEVHKGMETIGSALIYLYPPTMAAKSKVTFEDEAEGAGDGEIATVKKPLL